jgi:hypothetical protein
MQTLKIVAIAAIVILSLAAVKTVIPNEEVSKQCLLGYKAACSFAPISTAILVLVAISIFATAKRLAVI